MVNLRILDLITTAVGIKAGLTELNPIYRVRGIEGIIEANLMLFLPLGVLYVAAYYGRRKGLVYPDAILSGVLVAFIIFSLYVIVWNNVRVIAGA